MALRNKAKQLRMMRRGRMTMMGMVKPSRPQRRLVTGSLNSGSLIDGATGAKWLEKELNEDNRMRLKNGSLNSGSLIGGDAGAKWLEKELN